MKHYLLKALQKKKKFFSNCNEIDSDSEGSISSDDEDDVSKDIIYKLYNNRYIAIKYLGKGTFCRTWLMYDINEYKCVAMKMFFPKYYDDSKNELKINKLLTTNEYVVKLIDSFMYNKSNCLIYELLGITLFDILEYYDDNIPLPIVKKILIQVFKGIHEIHSHNIIHCDLKLENIMIQQLNGIIQNYVSILHNLNIEELLSELINKKLPLDYIKFDKNKKKNIKRKIKKKCYIELISIIKEKIENSIITDNFKLDELNIKCKIIDLGNSEIVGINNDDEIMSRSYRPPENIMNDFYNEKADIWTMGCLTYELITGEYLFDIDRDMDDNDKDRNHLHQMYELLGKIPKDYTLDCEYSDTLFDSHGRILNMKKCDYTCLEDVLIEDYNFVNNEANEIGVFLRHLLDYNIKTRYSAIEANENKWLNN